MAKSAQERLQQKKCAKKVVLEKNFAGIKAGQRMLVGTPKMIDAYIREIPCGQTRTVRRLRNELARRERCDAMCPVSTAIFVRIAAEAAIEVLDAGGTTEDVTPFWRLVGPDDKIAQRLAVDSAWLAAQRASEAN